MWKPGFAFEERVEATLYGAHRALCIYSVRHRGTREKPGIVLGLDRGGSCRGFAFRVAGAQAEATHAYLTEREQMNRVYRERLVKLRLADGRKVAALAYIVDRKGKQYAGRLEPKALLALIDQGDGESGLCRDYVLNTLDALAALGIEDHALAWLRPALAGR
jgi:cation transport protein ChaC